MFDSRRIVNIFVAVLLATSAVPSFGDERSADVLRRINAIRRSNGLPQVKENAMLVSAARSQSDWMASVGRMDHLREPSKSFDEFRKGCYHPSNRVIQSGYFLFEDLYAIEKGHSGVIVHPLPAANEKLGEIIAKGWGGYDAGDVSKIVAGWMNSPGHRSEILKGEYREAGVGITSPRPDEFYWCVVFAYR